MHRAAVWQHSSNSNIKIVHNSIEHFLWNPSDFSSDDVLSCLWIVFTNSFFQVPPQKIVWRVEILGIEWPGVTGLTQNESVPWEVMPEIFKCSFREMMWRLISRTEHLNTPCITSHGTDSFCIKPLTPVHPVPKISTCLTIFWGGTSKTEFVKTIHRQGRTSPEEKSDGFHKKCSIELSTILMFNLLLCCHTVCCCAVIQQCGAWNEHSINYWKNIVKHY